MTSSNSIGKAILRTISLRQSAAQRISSASCSFSAFEWFSQVERSSFVKADGPSCAVVEDACGSAATRQMFGDVYEVQKLCELSIKTGDGVSMPESASSGGVFANQLPACNLSLDIPFPNRLLGAGRHRLGLQQQHIDSFSGNQVRHITLCSSFAARDTVNTVSPAICIPRNYGTRTNERQPDDNKSSAIGQRETASEDVTTCTNLPSSSDSLQSNTHAPSGWTKQEVYNMPNLVSFARLASGPLIAHWIVSGQLKVALAALLVAGWSDWLDGWLARRYNQQSTLGTYLDPLADKVLICCVVTALGVQGTLPQYLATVIVGRDVFLVGAAFAMRALQLGWKRVSPSEFFRISCSSQASGGSEVPAAVRLEPLYLSKVNTVAQLATVSAFLLEASTGSLIHQDVLNSAAIVTTATTVLSGIAYVHAHRSIRHFATKLNSQTKLDQNRHK